MAAGEVGELPGEPRIDCWASTRWAPEPQGTSEYEIDPLASVHLYTVPARAVAVPRRINAAASATSQRSTSLRPLPEGAGHSLSGEIDGDVKSGTP